MESVYIDARVLGFGEKPCRIISVCDVASGLVSIAKEVKWSINELTGKNKDNTVIVTDAREIIKNWHLAFDPKEQLEDVISLYQLRNRAKLLSIEPTLTKYAPDNALQVRKIDKSGMQQEFDSSVLNNGHLAILLSVWASSKIALSNSMNDSDNTNKVDSSMMPFSI